MQKKVETKYTGGNAYSTSSERKLIYLDLNTKKESTILSMNRNDNIDWKLLVVQSEILSYMV